MGDQLAMGDGSYWQQPIVADQWWMVIGSGWFWMVILVF